MTDRVEVIAIAIVLIAFAYFAMGLFVGIELWCDEEAELDFLDFLIVTFFWLPIIAFKTKMGR